MLVSIPYGRTSLSFHVPDHRLKGIFSPRLEGFSPRSFEMAIVRESLDRPIGSSSLESLAKGKKKVTVISSDHTRPVPSSVILPLLLGEIRKGNPDAEVTILVATGGHRAPTKQELLERYGPEITSRERIFVHDSRDGKQLVHAGTLPSGGGLVLSRIALEADLLVAEGFIEPHFFAGFSGGRKSVLPGVAGYKTVLANHCAEFISSPAARTGILRGNPIHEDMVWAARKARLAFICNVVLHGGKRIAAAFSGDMEQAHERGCSFLERHAAVAAVPSDVVITGNGGYPLDQNLYQAVKAMTAGEAACREGGVIIVAAECADGHGGEAFYRAFEADGTPEGTMARILSRGRDSTEADQWQIQILCRVLMKHPVILVTTAPDEMVEHLGMRRAQSLQAAVSMAEEILGDPEASMTVIPDGISVIVNPPCPGGNGMENTSTGDVPIQETTSREEAETWST